ncbi:unnamed protein product [Linum tenue]|uniref:Uncharacterized protein n=1 Tax=Linum tenue TaxID=586396 RepID=A0AAV0R9Q8_9ROSI|nr:unnamed protein product [Linum tenue]
MVLFDFKSDKQFVASSDRATLQVYELTNPTANPSSIRNNHWKEVATITARDQIQKEDEEESYDGLMFFDGHGKIEGSEALTKLAQHLTRLQLRVSPQGMCSQDVTGLGEHKEFGFHYLRLNDLFNWPYHGIKMAGITTWRRLVLEYSVPKGDQKKRPMAVGAVVSKKKYEELKRMIEERDEKIGKMREEMEEQDWEMEKSRKKDGELETLKREKDEELEDKNKQSWLQTAATKLVPLHSHNDRIISTRRAVPQDTWSLSREIISGSFQHHSLVNNFYWPFSSANGLSLVDEDPEDWPPPHKIRVSIGPFDKDNWWFTRTTHPDGGLTMMAYYDGNFVSSNFPGNSYYRIRMPYAWDDGRFSADTACTLAMVGEEYKLAFMYRE